MASRLYLKFIFLLFVINYCFCFVICKTRARSLRRIKDYWMVSATQTTASRASKVSIEHLDIPKYMKAQMLPRHEIGKILTPLNRRNADMGYKLRSEYLKLRQLTREEEKSAGAFSQLGKRLEKIKRTLSQKLEREPTDEEWAIAARLNVPTLKLYRDMARRARERLVQVILATFAALF
jgi:hypothetical protein